MEYYCFQDWARLGVHDFKGVYSEARDISILQMMSLTFDFPTMETKEENEATITCYYHEELKDAINSMQHN